MGSEMVRARPLLLLLAGAAALFLVGLGHLPLFGRDEALYAEAGREMLASGDWITPRVNGRSFFEKPPLYYWLAATSYRALGVSPLAARLPSALMAILTVALTATVGGRVWGRRAGLLAGLALATSLQMVLIGRMGIMDVPLTCLTLLALLAYARWYRRGGTAAAAAFAACVALAILLKGMAGLIAPSVATIHALIGVARGHHIRLSWSSVGAAVTAIVLLAALTAPWFLAMNARHGGAFGATLFLREHFTRVVHPMQGHGGPVWYYLPLILLAFFPWIMFLPAAFSRRSQEDKSIAFWRSLSVLWIAVVLIPFSLVRTKLPGYVTPLFPPMALLVGAELDRRLREPSRAPWVAVIVGAVVLGGLAALLPVAGAVVGARVGAAHEAWLLVAPAAVWVGGYGLLALAAAEALRGRPGHGVGLMTGGQLVIIGALLVGVQPVLSPYLGGAEASLATIAQRELPDSQVVLYDTRPETVAFVLRRPVLTYDKKKEAELVERLQAGPTALVAPKREWRLWSRLPARRIWQAGDRVLLAVERVDRGPAER